MTKVLIIGAHGEIALIATRLFVTETDADLLYPWSGNPSLPKALPDPMDH